MPQTKALFIAFAISLAPTLATANTSAATHDIDGRDSNKMLKEARKAAGYKDDSSSDDHSHDSHSSDHHSSDKHASDDKSHDKKKESVTHYTLFSCASTQPSLFFIPLVGWLWRRRLQQ